MAESRSVSFCEEVTARIFRSASTEKGKHACYYQPAEFEEMKEDVMNTLWLMKGQHDLDDVHYTSRGLESLTGNNLARKTKRRERAIQAVLLEQEKQRATGRPGELDQTVIAEQYSKVCRRSKAEACETAVLDALAVFPLSQEDVDSEAITMPKQIFEPQSLTVRKCLSIAFREKRDLSPSRRLSRRSKLRTLHSKAA